MKKRTLALFLASAMMMGAFAGCGSTGDTAESAAPSEETTAPAEGEEGETPAADGAFTLKIGGIGPTTGGAAVYGQAVKNGAEIAVEEINAMGGMQIELNFQDDEHDAEKSGNAYNALKDWDMDVLMGTVTTAPALAVAPMTFEDRIFTLSPSASSTLVVEGNDNVFQICFTDPNQGAASAQFINDNEVATKVAVIYNNSDAYSTGIYESFVAGAEGTNIEIVATSTFTNDSASDFSVQLNDAKSAGAELIFLPIYAEPASLIMSQANAMDFAPIFFGCDGLDGILTLEGFDTTLAEGTMLLTPFAADATDDATVSFVTKYTEAYGDTPNQFAADGYDCIYALYQAAEAAGVTEEMTAEEICTLMIEQFTTMSFDGLTGAGMTWNTTGEVSKAPQAIVIQDGVYVGM